MRHAWGQTSKVPTRVALLLFSTLCSKASKLTKLELNTEKEGFMAYTAREDAQRPRAVYAINPDFRGI